MSVRDDIMAMACNPMKSYDDGEFARYRIGFHHAKNKAVEIAEASEKAQQAKLNALIAELRDIAEIAHFGGLENISESACLTLIRATTIPYFDGGGDDAYHKAKLQAILDKYKDKI